MKLYKHILLITGLLMMVSVTQSMAQDHLYENSVNALYEHVFLEDDRSDWNLAQFWVEREFTDLTTILRLRYADRFNQSAYLAETELYPVFSENTYAYVKLGASLTQKGLFPNFEASGILYTNLTPSLVGGAGLRYQSFDIEDVFVYNADLHWYAQDYLIMLQGFMQYRDKTPLGTGVLTLRKYFIYPDFIFLKLAYGQSPQGLRFEEDVLNTFESIFISGGGDFQLSNRFGMSAAVEYRNNTFSSVTSRRRYGFSVGLSYRF